MFCAHGNILRELEQPSSFYEVFPDTKPRNTHRIATQTLDASERPPLIGLSAARLSLVPHKTPPLIGSKMSQLRYQPMRAKTRTNPRAITTE